MATGDDAAREDHGEPELERAIVTLERLRVSLILGALVGLFVVLGVLFVVEEPIMREVSDRPELRFWTLGVVVCGIAAELALRRRLARCEVAGHSLPAAWRVAAVVCEIGVPTALMLSFTAFLSPTEALAAPPVLGYGVIVLLSTLSMNVFQCVLAGAGAAVAYVALAVHFRAAIASDFPGTFFAIWPPYAMRAAILLASGLIAGFITREIRRRAIQALRSGRERDRLRELFGQHVSPAVLDELLAHPSDPRPAERRITVLFADIRGFTGFSAARSPTEVIDYLNRLFGPLSGFVERNHGIVNKFLGDGFMAVFGAPLADPAAERHAVAAAREIVAEVERLVAAGAIPPTAIGVGLHAGVAVTGNVGSHRRKEYTLIGDTVNLAARIEQLTKVHGARILASGSVIDALGDAAPADATCLGPVAIRGREEAVTVYRLD